ncbi:MAG: iron-containing alcohol dehydrogenase [Ignavibacteriales bacterium]
MFNWDELKSGFPEELRRQQVFQTAGAKPHGKLLFGLGAIERLPEEASRLAGGKALLITGKHVRGMGMADFAGGLLERGGFTVTICDDVEPEPTIETGERVLDLCRRGGFSLVVGLGGGSPMDTAKACAILARDTISVDEYMRGKPVSATAVPKILIPTTSGTGSEMNGASVFRYAEKKASYAHPQGFADVALVDPALTATMPPRVTVATGLDALSHAVEACVSLNTTTISEPLAFKSVEYVFRYLKRAAVNGLDFEARNYMAWASVLGMMAYTAVGGLYAHSFSYILTMHREQPHGTGCGISLPYTLMLNISEIEPVLVRMASVVGVETRGMSSREIAVKVIDRFMWLLQDLGVAADLKSYGFSEADAHWMARELVEKYYRKANPRNLDVDTAENLMRSMLEGKPRPV